MRKEHELILELCKENDAIEVNMSREELRRLDWSEFLWQILYHRVECLIAKKKINGMNWGAMNEVVSSSLSDKFKYVRGRNCIFYEKELPEVIKILNSVTKDYVFMKGVVSAVSLYQDIGNRPFGDFDVLIRKRDLEKLKRAFRDAGYSAFGQYDLDGKITNLATREDIERIERYTDQTYALGKLVNHPFLYDVTVDPHFGFGRQSRSNVLDNEELVERIISRRQHYRSNETEFFGLSKEDFFLFSCLHTYKEEIEVYRLESGSDGRLYQFAELYRILKKWYKEMDWDYIRRLSEEIDIKKHVYYCVYHCSNAFDDIKPLVGDLLKEFEPEDKGYLDEYGGIDADEIGRWKAPFVERLFIKDKYRLIKDTIKKIYY